MDQQDMQDLLAGYFAEADWGNGLDRAAVVGLVTDDEALRNLLSQYLPEATYRGPEDVLNLLPEQAWQDTQGDRWRGGEPANTPNPATAFADSPVGRDQSDVYRQGEPAPPTPGFGHTHETDTA